VSDKGERIVEIKEDYSPGIPGIYELNLRPYLTVFGLKYN
jgi:hypothetical protein